MDSLMTSKRLCEDKRDGMIRWCSKMLSCVKLELAWRSGAAQYLLETCNIWDVLGRQALLFGHVECTLHFPPFEAAAISTLHSYTACTASSLKRKRTD